MFQDLGLDICMIRIITAQLLALRLVLCVLWCLCVFADSLLLCYLDFEFRDFIPHFLSCTLQEYQTPFLLAFVGEGVVFKIGS